ncbi:MAG TPA: hypothetical protein VFX30_09185 [bacterium]|nr:hypothetical protein [bacterium]
MIKQTMIVATIVGILFGSAAAMAGAPRTKADYTAEAQRYEKMATEEQALAKEHEQMKRDYRAHQADLPKQTREKSLTEMDDHCDAIISAARKLADEYTALAQWHRHIAGELK